MKMFILSTIYTAKDGANRAYDGFARIEFYEKKLMLREKLRMFGVARS